MKGESTKFAIPIQKMRLANLQCDTLEMINKRSLKLQKFKIEIEITKSTFPKNQMNKILNVWDCNLPVCKYKSIGN